MFLPLGFLVSSSPAEAHQPNTNHPPVQPSFIGQAHRHRQLIKQSQPLRDNNKPSEPCPASEATLPSPAQAQAQPSLYRLLLCFAVLFALLVLCLCALLSPVGGHQPLFRLLFFAHPKLSLPHSPPPLPPSSLSNLLAPRPPSNSSWPERRRVSSLTHMRLHATLASTRITCASCSQLRASHSQSLQQPDPHAHPWPLIDPGCCGCRSTTQSSTPKVLGPVRRPPSTSIRPSIR